MSEEFLSPDELIKGLESFKEKWYGIAEKSEALSNYKSGFDAGFEKAITDLYHEVESCKEDIESFSLSVEHHIPESRGGIKELSGSIIGGIERLRDTLHHDLKILKDYYSLRTKLAGFEREFKDVEKRYKIASDQAEKTFGEYKDKSNAYEDAVQKIKGASDKNLSKIRKKYLDNFHEVFGGFDLVTRDYGKKIDQFTLFSSLLVDDDFIDKIEIRPKGLGGLIGAKKSELEVRKTLLEYKIEEILKETKPVLEDEKRKLKKYESELSHIEELKKTAQSLEEDREEVEQEKEGLERKIEKIKSKGDEIMGKFQDYEKILDLREGYMQSFNEINTDRRSFFRLIEDALQTYEAPELDFEKRELKEENRAMSQAIKEKEESILKLENELGGITKEYESSKAIFEKQSAEIRRLVSAIKEQENRINELEYKSTEDTGKLGEHSQRLSLSEKKQGDYKLGIQRGEELRAMLERENTKLKSELQKTLPKFEHFVEGHKKMEGEVQRVRGELKKHRAAYTVLENRYHKTGKGDGMPGLGDKTPLKVRKKPSPSNDEREEERIVIDKIDALRKREGNN